MKIAFTSCFRYEAFKEQKEWDYIAAQKPDYLFLLGDTVYMDYGIFNRESLGKPSKYTVDEFRKAMSTKYKNQFENVHSFKALVETMRQKNGFYAIWDDHDFGWNNAKGADMCIEKKDIARELFHQYTQCSTNMPHVYYHVDTPLARAIFLDNRTDAEKGGANSILLSEAQFAFLEDKLQHNLPYTLVCGGLTLTEGSENWTKYPAQLERLCKLLGGRKKLIFLSGDIHYNTFKKPIALKNGCTTPVQLISSGLGINILGFGIRLNKHHNWAMLHLEENKKASVAFYKGDKLQADLSAEASKWI